MKNNVKCELSVFLVSKQVPVFCFITIGCCGQSMLHYCYWKFLWLQNDTNLRNVVDIFQSAVIMELALPVYKLNITSQGGHSVDCCSKNHSES